MTANGAKNTNTHIGKALLASSRAGAQQQSVANTMASVTSLSDAQQQLGVYLEHLDQINKFQDYFTGKHSVVTNDVLLSNVLPLPAGVSVKDFTILRKTLVDELFPKGQKNQNKVMDHPFEFSTSTATWHLKNNDDDSENIPVPVSYEAFVNRLQDDPPRPELLRQVFKVGKAKDARNPVKTIKNFQEDAELETKDAKDLKVRNEQLHEELQKLRVEKLEAENLLLSSQLELLRAQAQIPASLPESNHKSKHKHRSHQSSKSSKGHHQEHDRRRHREDSQDKNTDGNSSKKGRYYYS
jgi:hypothetical protein